jgi:cholesterol oxidase
LDEDYDFIVIGSGFGGSVSALRLAEKGYRVAVLEMGKRYRPHEFARTNWNLRRFLWMPKLLLYGIQQLTLLRDVFVLHGAGVGGGSLVYANTLLVPPDEAFAQPGWVGLDWRAALAPHYDTARRMLGAVVTERVEATDEMLREVATELGFGDTFHRTTVGVYFGTPGETVPDPYFGGAGPPRTGCTRCGACMIGCRVGAKNTLDRNYLYLAERLGAAIVAETRVLDVRAIGARGAGGYELHVERSTAPLRRRARTLRARGVVFSAGVLGTVPLLLRCKERGSLPELSDRLGTYVRTNSEALVAATTGARDVDYSRGIAISAGAWADARTHIEVVRYPSGSDAMSRLATVLTGGGPPWPRQLRFLAAALRHPVQLLRLAVPFGWARRTAILLVMQPIENFLRLRLRRRWYWPFRRRLSSERSERAAPTYIPIANEVARRMAAKMKRGIPQSGVLEAVFDVSTTAHILGGCPIGAGPDTGVIDPHSRVHGYDNLYVIDGSMIPANLGVNPSLTITAMAEHAMSHIPPRR